MNTTTVSDEIEVRMAAFRQEMLAQETMGYEWRGNLLAPYSAQRELWFQMITKQMGKMPEYEECLTLDGVAELDEFVQERQAQLLQAGSTLRLNEFTNWTRFVPEAATVLWLCHHTREEVLAWRGKVEQCTDEIMAWQERNVPQGMIEQAVRLAVKLRTAHKQFITIPKPVGGASGGDAGN